MRELSAGPFPRGAAGGPLCTALDSRGPKSPPCPHGCDLRAGCRSEQDEGSVPGTGHPGGRDWSLNAHIPEDYLSAVLRSSSAVLLSFLLLQPSPQHADVPRPGIEPSPQQPPRQLKGQHQILNPLCHKRTPSHMILTVLSSCLMAASKLSQEV